MADNQSEQPVQVETRPGVAKGTGEPIGRTFAARAAHRYDEPLSGDIDPEHPDGKSTDDHLGRRGD